MLNERLTQTTNHNVLFNPPLYYVLVGKTVNIMDWFSMLTLEIILSTAFGIKADVQTDPDDKLLTKARQSFRFPFILRILGRIPFVRTIVRLVMRLRGSMGYFGKIALEMLRQRRAEGDTNRQDLMQLMLTAHEESTVHGVSKLTDEEIVAQCVAFLLAGHETSMITLHHSLLSGVKSRNSGEVAKGYFSAH